MDRLSLMLAVIVAGLFAASVPSFSEPYGASGSGSDYGPYKGEDKTPKDEHFQYRGSDAALPAPGNGSEGARPSYSAAPAPAPRSGSQQGWNPDAGYAVSRPGGSMGDAYSPSRDGQAPSARGGPGGEGRGPDAPMPRVEVQAAAPDDGIPSSVREDDARRAAIDGWQGKVADQYGSEFSDWRSAIGKHVDCHTDRRDGIICTASGQPVRGGGPYGENPTR